MPPQGKDHLNDDLRQKPMNQREEIVISGISGRFPDSDNMKHFQENLMNKVDMISGDDRRWNIDHPEIPQRTGKINNIHKFDADFFGIDFKHAHTMDPSARILLENTFEAIVDAGVNPGDLRNTNTGVFIGACSLESFMYWVFLKTEQDKEGLGLLGSTKALLARRISHWLGITGPCCILDSACSSSLFAMEHAYRAIQNGVCDAALVAGTNLCLHPGPSFQFARLGVLTFDGISRPFDNTAGGYVRAETISVVFLQKAKDAKRVYANFVYAKTNCDGFKPQGITFPSSQMQSVLLKECYAECNVPPSSLSYIETHGTGTKVGDPEELNAIAEVFCPGRKDSLKIGSVKSNIGHSESSSGMGQIAKVVIACETGVIPPNLNYKTPREGVEALVDGRLTVVTEPTPWDGGYVGISSFGFGGGNAHILFKSYSKKKVNGGAPLDDLPRLVAVSGRTEEAVDALLSDVESRPVDVEYVRLLQDLHAKNIFGHNYRGFTILSTSGTKKTIRDIKPYPGKKRPVWFVFSGVGSAWPSMGTSLLRFPVFANAIKRCDAVLKNYGVNIYATLTNSNKLVFDSIVNSSVGVAAVQIGLVDLLTSLKIVPDGMMGHSVGELVCAYADGCLTAEQVILATYYRSKALKEINDVKGAMAIVGLGYQDIKNICRPDIELASHNSPESSIISGPVESVRAFVARLTANNIFAEEIACNGIAYHSGYIADVGPQLFSHLKKLIPIPTPRSSKWYSTSVPKSQWNSAQVRLASAEYFTNNLLSPVLFEETTAVIPKNAITIEIAPHGILQEILKQSLNPKTTNVALMQAGHEDNIEFFLQAIGELYEAGLQPAVWNLYPQVPFPVSRGTPMISPLVKWDHSEDWYVTRHHPKYKFDVGEVKLEISLNDDNYEYMKGHVIDGRTLLPATGYLALIWGTLGQMHAQTPVVFENIKFLRATNISKEPVTLIVMIQKGTGNFEIIDGDVAVVTGTVRAVMNPSEEEIIIPLPHDDEPEKLTAKDCYKEFRLRGYQYSGPFRAIQSASIDGSKGTLRWNSNWVAFMDTMLQMMLLGRDTRALMVPTEIRKITINTKKHAKMLRSMTVEKQEFKVYVSQKHDLIQSGGIQIRGLRASAIARRKPMSNPVLETYQFIAHRDNAETTLREAILLSTHIALENHLGIKVTTIEFLESGEKYAAEDLLSFHLSETLADLPVIRADINITAPENCFEEEELPKSYTFLESKKLVEDNSAMMMVGRDILKKNAIFEQVAALLKEGSFFATLESSEDVDLSLEKYGLLVVLEKMVGSSKFLLFRKKEKVPKHTSVVKVNNEEFSWTAELKEAMKNATGAPGTSRIILVSDKTFENGLLGLTNCLRREPGGELIRGVLIQDSQAPDFSLSLPLYNDQLKLDLSMNVLREDATWGSYRHLPLPAPTPRPMYHAWANQLVRGDLSSFRWMEGSITPDTKDSDLVRVAYSSINFKDIMLATGKLNADNFVTSRSAAECVLGFEYSGITTNGRRVMGVTNYRAFTNILKPDPAFTWTVPDSWSLEEAASVPAVYATCFYAFYIRGSMKKGDKVLIHAGSGGVGQAAINIALWAGCEVFTTVGTVDKRLFIRKTFPQIPEDHIGNSRDTSFEQMIMNETNGRGVDIVLNSLAEDKLQASVRCLAEGGRFLEIGKFDMAANNPLGMSAFAKGITFHGVLLDRLIDAELEFKMELCQKMQKGLDMGIVKPLNVTVFPVDQIEQAFRFMATGKHIGKIVLKIQDESNLNSQPIAYERYHCKADRSYLILGGLGGFGLELADWLILRGARYITLTSRGGIKNGYQLMRIKLWESYGVKLTLVSGKDLSDPKDCEELLRMASEQAPIDGIFNLAVVLKDALFENQTPETFEELFKSKAWATRNLDKFSRRMCPELRHFVVFSSVSCGRGNVGQTNYGMSNSVMERICERRAAEGLPALAIQWGVIGDVGIIADMQDNDKVLVIGGTLQQRISSCLHELDGFLNQKSPIVASMVVAEKRAGGSGNLNVVETVLNIMGLKDLKSVGIHTSLAELGMDSMMAVEIKQTLEREFDIFLNAQDIRGLNFAKLIEMNSKDADGKKKDGEKGEILTGLKLLVTLVGDNEQHDEIVVKLPTKEKSSKPGIFLIPGMEGSCAVFKNLAVKIDAPATCLQFPSSDTQYRSVEDIARNLFPYILEQNQNRKDFTIIAYSFGSLVAIELARMLEAQDLKAKLILIDGSPVWLKTVKQQQLLSESNDDLENNILIGIVDMVEPAKSAELFVEFKKCKTWDEKLDILLEAAPRNHLGYSAESRRNMCTSVYQRVKALDNYDISGVPLIKSPIVLLKSALSAVKSLPEDYGLSEVTEGKIESYMLDGNHLTILDNQKLANVINGEPMEESEPTKASIIESEKIITSITEANPEKTLR